MVAYAESKLANLLFVRERAARGVRAYASDPGMTDTGITRSLASRLPVGERNPVWRILQSPDQGARASVQALTTDLPSGTYLAPRFNQWAGRGSPVCARRPAIQWRPVGSGNCRPS